MKIKIDSRKVVKGDTFIAIRGVKEDGHKYIKDAIEKGADTIVAEYGDYDVNTIIVSDTKKYLEEYLENNYYISYNNIIENNCQLLFFIIDINLIY